MTPSLTEAEIARRLPVWAALSDLFLDTDVMLSVPYIARTIMESGYPLDEVELMLRWEVRPAFWGNLLSVAGEWAGWPEDFVRDRVLACGGKRVERWLIGRDRFFPREGWAAVIAAVQAAASAASVSAIQPPPSTRSPA